MIRTFCLAAALPVLAVSMPAPAFSQDASIRVDGRRLSPVLHEAEMLPRLQDVAEVLGSNTGDFGYWCIHYDGYAGGMEPRCITDATFPERRRFTSISIQNGQIEMTTIMGENLSVEMRLRDIGPVELFRLNRPKEFWNFALKINPSEAAIDRRGYILLISDEETGEAVANAFHSLGAAASGQHQFARPVPPFGIGARDLSEAEKAHYAILDGIMVGAVEADSPASSLGVLSGDVILQLNGWDIDSPATANEIIEREAIVSARVLREAEVVELHLLTRM